MKKTKILTSVLLILALAFSLSVTAFAVTGTGSITIKNPIENKDYYLYRIFDLESYYYNSETDNAYSYKLNSKWKAFAEMESINNRYIKIENDYVTWIAGTDDETIKTFAKLALDYANTNGIEIDDGLTTASTDDLVFTDLPLGYYLIDSSVGSLCSLTTNGPDATVSEKNKLTTIDKKVKEESTGVYGEENSAQIGDTVHFKSNVTVGAGVENLVVHDVMDKGLTLNADSIKVYVGQTDTEVSTDNYTVKSTGFDDECTFEIEFKNTYTGTLNAGDVLRIEYSAVLNATATIAEESNNNKSWVSFGDNHTSTTSTTKTYTYKFDLIKVKPDGTVIGTAKFLLYDAETGGNVIKLQEVMADDTNGIYVYRVATETDNISGNGKEIKAGYANIYGLDNKVYYLEETEQPEGYNRLTERVKVDLTSGNFIATKGSDFTTGAVFGKNVTDKGGVQVINNSGTVLPSTGGIGTTLFYVCGGILVAAAGILLITSRRVGKEKKYR